MTTLAQRVIDGQDGHHCYTSRFVRVLDGRGRRRSGPSGSGFQMCLYVCVCVCAGVPFLSFPPACVSKSCRSCIRAGDRLFERGGAAYASGGPLMLAAGRIS